MRASLAELEAVSAVARTRGFRAAARELNISSSALSHAISALEDRLGVRLFNLTTRSVALTDAGERFVTDIAPALSMLDGALEAVGEKSAEVSGTLRINTSHGAARMLLTPLFVEYGARHPQVGLEIVTEEALVDVLGQGFDAGIRLAELVPPDMIAVSILPAIRSVVVGAPDYLNARGRPVLPADLMQHQCIRARMGTGKLYRWEFQKHGQALLIDAPGRLTLDEPDLMLHAALAGAGLAYIGEPQVVEHVTAGRLEIVLEDWTPPYPGLSLYFAGRQHIPGRLRALIDLIREQARAAG